MTFERFVIEKSGPGKTHENGLALPAVRPARRSLVWLQLRCTEPIREILVGNDIPSLYVVTAVQGPIRDAPATTADVILGLPIAMCPAQWRGKND